MANNRLAALGTAGVAAFVLAAAAFVQPFEGTVLKTYRDPIGILTDCTGHTGPDVREFKYNTLAECQAKLQADLLTANDTVESCITAPLTQNQRIALVSFTFNVGPGRKGVKDGMCVLKSGAQPSLVRHFNAGNPAAGCHELPKWANPPLKGIVKRRAAEEAICLTK